MERILVTKNNTIVVVYDDGTVDKPTKLVDGRILYKHPKLANPFVRANVEDRFLELEHRDRVFFD